MPVTQVAVNSARGLNTQANSFSAVPDGSYEVAQNVVVSSDGIIKKRRGFAELTAASALTSPVALVPYLGFLLVAHNNGLAALNTTTGAVGASLGSLVPESGVKPRYAEASGNLYVTSSAGIRKVESPTSAILPAGIPGGLDLQVTSAAVSATTIGVFEPDSQVGYRILFGRKDANNNLVLGSPSEFTTAANATTAASSASGAATTVTVNTSAPHGQSGTFRVKISNVTGLPAAAGDYTATVTGASTFQFTVASASSVTGLTWGAYRRPSATFTVPAGLSTEYLYQVYRTAGSAAAAVLPDESTLQLVYEANLTSAEVASGAVAWADEVPEELRGAFLYTNPNTGGGIAAANDQPPFARDVAAYNGHLFYGDTATRYEVTVSLVSTQAGDLDLNDYIEVTSGATTRRYTAKATEALNTAGGGDFVLTSSTSTTVATAIDSTARSLVKVINRDASSPVFAYYTSALDEVPGEIRLVSKAFTPTFRVTAVDAATADAFSPALGYNVATQTRVQGDNFVRRNGLYFSKLNEPEAVPRGNFLEVGSKNSPIQRIVALRDSLIVLKSDGVYRVNGDVGSFTVTLLDGTLQCRAAGSVASLNNQVYFVSNQGVTAVSDSGANVVSRPIETSLTAVIGKSYFAEETNAVGYESERLYCLSTVGPTATTADTVYVFNAATEAWTTWDTVYDDAVVEPATDVLYTLAGGVKKERKTLTKLDYCGQDYACAITAVGSDQLTAELSVPGATPQVGDVVVVGDVISRIVSIGSVNGVITYTFGATVNFEAGDVGRLYKYFTSTLVTSPIHAGSVGLMKQFSEVQVHFRNRSCSALTVSYFTDTLLGSGTQPWTAYSQADGWGAQPWGLFPWGEAEGISLVLGTQASQPLRLWPPVEAQRATWIQMKAVHARAAEPCEVQAVVVSARSYSTRTTR